MTVCKFCRSGNKVMQKNN